MNIRTSIRFTTRAAALALTLVVAVAAAASADSLVADGDGLAPANNNNNNVRLGTVCQGTQVEKTVVLGIRKGNSAPAFQAGAVVRITVTSTSNGLAATAGEAAITIPGDWASRPQNSMSDLTSGGADNPAGRTTSKVTLNTTGLLGNYNGHVTYRATSGTLTDEETIVWHATVAACDSTAPTLTVPGNMTVEATSSAGATVTYVVTATDNLDTTPTVSCLPASGSVFAFGTTTVNCTATDDAGNSSNASFTITVQDTTKPVVTPPAGVSVEATGPSGATVTYGAASATDSVDGSLPATCLPASGSTFAVGSTTVTCSATDSRGNTGSATFEVVVTDETAPVLSLPANITAEATSAGGAVMTYTASASDLVDGSVTVICLPASGSTFPLDVPTTVDCSATDAHDNQATGSFTVTVLDRTGPVVTVPANITQEATSSAGAPVTFSASALDAVDGSTTVTCVPASGSTFPIDATTGGTVTTVECSSSDTRGNPGSASFTVTIRDTTPPTLTLPADQTLEATSASGADGSTADFTASANDIVDGAVTVTCDHDANDTYPLDVATEVACSATDAHGNKASGSFFITVEDTTAPAITVPADITAEATGPTGTEVTFSTSATDLVDGTVAVTCVPASGSTFAIGTTEVTCSAEDSRGNDDSKSFDVTVVDTTPPTITFVSKSPSSAWSNSPVTVTWSCADTASGPVSPTVQRIVSTEGVSQDVTGTCYDVAGNSASNTQQVSIDLTGPVATITTPANGGQYTLNSALSSSFSCNDTLSGVATCTGPASVDTSSIGSKSFTVDATDVAGNTSSTSSAYSVRYASTGDCMGAPGHAILQPVNRDGTSTFKRGSTVPAKFRVCDGQGVSIGTPGLVTDFKLVAKSSSPQAGVNEPVYSTTPDTAFRWSPSDRQWIFNVSTNNLTSGVKYTYRITLDDGSTIEFAFSVK